MVKNQIKLVPSYWASVSGGKDSLYMLYIILNNLDRYKLDGVVHADLEIDFPFIKDVIDTMERDCKKHGIPFIRIKPRKTWNELYNKYGFPTRKARWCNGQYKLDAFRQLDEFLKSKGQYAIHYIGYCKDEVNRYEKRKNKNEIYPLVDLGIEEKTILEWAKNIPIFNDYYKYNTRCGCMKCPLQSMKNSAYIRKYYPEEYLEMMKQAQATEKQREQELGRPFSVWSSNPKYNTEYRIKRIEEKYFSINKTINKPSNKKVEVFKMEELTTIKTTELTNKELKDYTKKLKNCGDNIRKNYIKISFLLNEIESSECYLDDGFEDTIDYASKVLNIQKTTTYNLLKIGKEFIAESGERTVLTDKGNDYGVSQLQALLPVGVERAKELHDDGTITPDMSVRQIKQIIKDETNPDNEHEDTDVVDGEVVDETDNYVPVFGDIQFLKDGTIIPSGVVPDTFILKVEELFKELLEDFQTLDEE